MKTIYKHFPFPVIYQKKSIITGKEVILQIFIKELKRYDEAIDAYQTAIDIEPSKAISWANLGILYEELKLKNEAKNCYNKAKDIAIKNKDYKTAARFEEWENSI